MFTFHQFTILLLSSAKSKILGSTGGLMPSGGLYIMFDCKVKPS
jgi:hypothetical protein